MTKQARSALFLVALAAGGCDRTPAGRPQPAAVAPSAAVALPAAAPSEDAHWFQPDDYLVFVDRHTSSRHYFAAKMTTPASEATQGEAKFLTATDVEASTTDFARTRPAKAGDLTVGATIYCTWYGKSPKDKDEARKGDWSRVTITSTSDLERGAVTISAVGNPPCEVGAIRVPVAR